MNTFTSNFSNSGLNPAPLISIPDECPHCGRAISAQTISTASLDFGSDGSAAKLIGISVHRCTHSSCKKFFFTTHYIFKEKNNLSVANFLSVYPSSKTQIFDEVIIACSPQFSSIYNGAYEAEQNGYIEVAGAGYRMALEYLMKDFLIAEHPEDTKKIATNSLDKCISEYFSMNQDIINTADVVRILGNDYVHYVSKHENIELSTIRTYLDFFISIIHTKLKIKNPPVSRHQ